ncbi:aspartate aminotransferase family protein [Conexibacter arvalis]|uniref:Glutamate-1-semialdehyde 2,1-aminomutase n=1 Tax=Conexibacter arvalis TaxID=912552 RepID=A0A840ICE9_9ACTN|nr:aminotransferase class III-fold pyridoxal phosphate-dependent enzyme [Conexibacter arvalis]MBB4662005.1 glutamate-1-semialdehyde 2,1-aminomutase [Conexibacter arvalis]
MPVPRSVISLPLADQLHERAVRSLPGGNTRTTLFVPPHPPYAAKGSGCRLVDVDGNVLVDLQNNYTALIHGHANREIAAAANAAIAEGASFGMPTRHEIELAELLCERVAIADRWRFANSGTEAVMVAIRLARAVTGRAAVLRFAGAYHGSADVVLAAGAPGVPAGVSADVVEVPVGDLPALLAALDEHGERLACVLFDAMPNRAGLRPAEREYVRTLRAETARRGILLLQDEVLTFRVAHGGLQSLYDCEPDITTLGKVIGGGFPIGAIGGRAEIMEAFDPARDGAVGHGGTFSANPVSMRAGRVAMELLTRAEIERLNALGEQLRKALAEQGWTVTGLGSLARVHVDDPAQLWWRLYREGVLIAANGLLCLSTPMDEAVVDHVAGAFERVAGQVGTSSAALAQTQE